MDEKIVEVLTRGVEQVLPSKKALGALMRKRKIKLYQGFDPTAPSLHLGNLVGLMKLRAFQKLGHEVIFLAGDFTGMIGDPTDKLAVRKKLTRQQVLQNAKDWKKQASLVLDFTGKNPVKMLFNSEWNDKLSFAETMNLMSKATYAQIIERDMFQERMKQNKDIWLHEFMYPIIQGYDSVHMEVDLEIGGNDQLFNMMVGRKLMKAMKNKEKYVLTTKLLVDKEGNKVGKTTGNALFLDSTPIDFFAGIMSFPDEVIYLGFELLTERNLDGLKERIKKDPMKMKKELAFEIVKFLWGEKEAQNASLAFEKTFQKKAPEFSVKIPKLRSLTETIAPYTGLQSTSDAKRLIHQGGVEVNGDVIADVNYKIKKGDKIRIGKKVFGTIN